MRPCRGGKIFSGGTKIPQLLLDVIYATPPLISSINRTAFPQFPHVPFLASRYASGGGFDPLRSSRKLAVSAYKSRLIFILGFRPKRVVVRRIWLSGGELMTATGL